MPAAGAASGVMATRVAGVAPRASSRLAMLTHAIKRTRSAALNSTINVC
jgi:hypothetical protein